MKKSWFTVQAAADGRTAQVAVRGYIGEWGVTDRDFIAAVEAHGEVDTIEVAINSRGGEVDHALSIFNFLKNHPARVSMRVDGVAMSAASIILMAGDDIAMPANAILMVHQPSTFASGKADDLRDAADMLDTFEAALLETYLARTGKTAAELTALLADETFMTAKEAVENGFADRVIPLKAEARAAAAVAYAAALDIPEDVLARAQAEALADADGEDALRQAQGERAGEGEDALRQARGERAGEGEDALRQARGERTEDHPGAGGEDDIAPLPESLSSRIAAAAAEAGLSEFAPCLALDSSLTDMAGVRQALADAREVVDLCGMVGLADAAPDLVRRRVGLAEARAALQARLADLDEGSHTDSTPRAGQAQPAAAASAVSVTSIWEARRKAGARS